MSLQASTVPITKKVKLNFIFIWLFLNKIVKTNPHFDQSTFSQLHHKIKHAKSENKISQFNLDEYKEKIIKFSLKVEEKRKKEQINANYNDFQKKSNLTEISSRDDLFGLYDQIHEEYFLEKKGLLYYSNKYERSLQKKFKPRNWTKNDQILLLWTIENYCFLSNLTTENLVFYINIYVYILILSI